MSDLFSDSLQTAIATQQEYRLPSVFEIFAQENLRHSVRPAFEHLVKVMVAVQAGSSYLCHTKSRQIVTVSNKNCR